VARYCRWELEYSPYQWRWARLRAAPYLHLSILVQNLATMLGLGLGIDYALLIVSRFREALAEGYDPGQAAELLPGKREDTANLGHDSGDRIFSAADCAHHELRSIGITGLWSPF